MSTNQENRHFTFKEQHNAGGAAVKLEEDHLLGYRSTAGVQATGTFNETRLSFLNAFLTASYASLPEAMQAFAVAQGVANWSSIGGKNTGEPPVPIQGNSRVAENGLTVVIAFDIAITATATQEANGWSIWLGNTQKSIASAAIVGQELRFTLNAPLIPKGARPVLAFYDASAGSLTGTVAPNPAVTSIFGFEVPNGSQEE